MRALVAGVLAAALWPARADACIRASEADKLVAWSADGAYALLEATGEKGALDHAEILPTTYAGFVYVVTRDDSGKGMIVTRVKVGTCASFGDTDGGGSVVERAAKPLTDANLRALKTFAPLRFGRDETPSAGPLPAAAFTGPKRYDVHDLAIAGANVAVPVWCVGSCLADENWTKWKVTVDATHTLASGLVLTEVSLANVCNGGTLHRLVAPTPASIKVPKKRCTGSGDE